MTRVVELKRLNSPAPKPQSLVCDGSVLWMGSRQTHEVHAIDVAQWKVTWKTTAPGTPYGMTKVNGELRVLCSETAEDHRIIRRCIPYRGFDPKWSLPCPDDTGSQLSYDGRQLHVSQWYPKKVIALDDVGQPGRVLNAPHGICGQVFAAGTLYLMTTDNEDSIDYWLTRVDLSGVNPKFEDIAQVPFAARALAFDGQNFWTNHREENQIVCFARPDA